MTMVPAGSTTHFAVSYDDSLAQLGAKAAETVLAHCEEDHKRLAELWVGTPVPTAIQVSIVSGSGGAFHSGRILTILLPSTSDLLGLPGLMVAEVSEMYMEEQEAILLKANRKGFNPGFSHGEGLSRVLAAELYPQVAGRFSSGGSWLDLQARPDWVNKTEPTDQDGVSYGCAALFLNYLHYQLGFSWQQVIAAADANLGLVAQRLNVATPFEDFAAVVGRHYPPPAKAGEHAGPLPHDPEGPGFPIDNLFPLSCLYIRHNVADTGTSHGGTLTESPDIIVKNAAVADPETAYSTPGSIASATESDQFVIDTQDNFLYLRAWNLGRDASNVTATAYWASPSTLVTPNQWNLIGHADFPEVPGGRIVRVSAPGITWQQSAIPLPGHYCFVATVGAPGDPAPKPSSFATFNDYVAYIAANNNIAWRNFNVIEVAKDERFHVHVLPFLIAGAWDSPRPFVFEVLTDLPKDSALKLLIPEWMWRVFESTVGEVEGIEEAKPGPDGESRVLVPLRPNIATLLGKVELPKGTEVASELHVTLRREEKSKPNDLAIVQNYRGMELGRVTWSFCDA